MRAIPVLSVTELRRNASAVLRRLRSSGTPLVITRRGRAAAVMLSVEAYERAGHELRLLTVLARAECEIAAGEGHDLRDVLAEARLAEDEAPLTPPRGR